MSSHRPGIWGRAHYLDRMTLGELVLAYFQHYAIRAYLLLAVLLIGTTLWLGGDARGPLLGAGAAMLSYPLAWYLIHRYLLHSRWAWKYPALAATWKRVHYDHHQDPNHLEVLFGALKTTLPTLVLLMAPPGWALGGLAGAFSGVAAALLMTCVYEFIHCIQHLPYKPRNRWLAAMKRHHMAHHFHDETGNFGIMAFWPDRMFGTFYEREQRPDKSPTVFNLGYTEAVAARYPWVAQLSGGVVRGHPRRRAAADKVPLA
jgi:sterol desaturase/sphingolipid hydroxylase (fatty acid hydroxylase superfamily)